MSLILLIVMAVSAMAQVASSGISGVVRDQSSAVVRGARVSARHELTGFLREVVSSDEGDYRIDGLLPGMYTLTAEKPNFLAVTAREVVLAVNQTGHLDFELKPGSSQESITVTAAVSPVDTDNASVGYRI